MPVVLYVHISAIPRTEVLIDSVWLTHYVTSYPVMVVTTVPALAVGMVSSARLINIPVNTDAMRSNDLFLHKH